MHLFYLKRSGDGGRGSLEMMAFLVKGWKLNLIISVKITQEHLWFYTLLKEFPTKTSGNICRSRASGNQKGKVHGKNTTFYDSSMPGTVREKLSSRKFPDIWTLVGIYGWQLPEIRGAGKMAGCVPYSPPRHLKTWISCWVFTISDTQEIGQHGMASQNALEREREGEEESGVLSGFFPLMLDLLLYPTQAPHVPRNLRNAPKRTAGILQKWDSERGFGFIHEEDDTCAVAFKLKRVRWYALMWIMHSVLTSQVIGEPRWPSYFFSVFCWEKDARWGANEYLLASQQPHGLYTRWIQIWGGREMRPVVDVFGRCLLADGSSTTTFMFWLSFGI